MGHYFLDTQYMLYIFRTTAQKKGNWTLAYRILEVVHDVGGVGQAEGSRLLGLKR